MLFLMCFPFLVVKNALYKVFLAASKHYGVDNRTE